MKTYEYEGIVWEVIRILSKVNYDTELTLKNGSEYLILIAHEDGTVEEDCRWDEDCAECRFSVNPDEES